MMPSEIRAELLRQHAEIRALMERTRTIAERASKGAPVDDDLRASLVQLADALRRHNLQEEALLGDIIPAVDAWGAARAEIMTEEHVREHAGLYAALLGTPCTPIEFAGAAIDSLLGAMAVHMAREEEAFLGEDVLRDDVVVVTQSGG